MQTLSCFETYHWHIIVLRNSWSNHTLWAKERLTQHTINHFFPTFLGKIRWNDQIKVLVTQLCPTLCNSKNCSPPGSSVHEIVQARILEWVAISFSRESSWPRNQTQVSRIVGRFFTESSGDQNDQTLTIIDSAQTVTSYMFKTSRARHAHMILTQTSPGCGGGEPRCCWGHSEWQSPVPAIMKVVTTLVHSWRGQ